MADDGHKYSFGAPKGGWPDFAPDGRRSKELVDTGICGRCFGDLDKPRAAKASEDCHGTDYLP